ncbi:hypothetical protein QQ045_010687 [Rhodiola kirilowii]
MCFSASCLKLRFQPLNLKYLYYCGRGSSLIVARNLTCLLFHRTKLKQTELDYEYLKKCCETLTDENRRLAKELKELKALKHAAQPNRMKFPAATLSICSSCEGVSTALTRGGDCSSKPNKFFNTAA